MSLSKIQYRKYMYKNKRSNSKKKSQFANTIS